MFDPLYRPVQDSVPVIAAPVEVKVATGVVNVVPPTAVDGVISKVSDATIDAATLQLFCVPATKLGRNNIPTPLLPRTDKVSCWSLPLERLIIPVVNAPVLRRSRSDCCGV
jgi:hypothetical protein